MRPEQTVSEMVVESLARRTQALSEENKRPFEEAFAEVLETPAGRLLVELADGPHRHRKAAEWQASLLADREAKRPPHLHESASTQETVRHSWLERYIEWVEGTDEREEYHAFLRRRFASLAG